MEKKDFVKYLDNLFKPFGFQKKGKNWYVESEELIKTINIQKSKFGDNYYLNYGFILKSLDLLNLEMHIFNRLGSLNDAENQRIMKLLDFEQSIDEEQRRIELSSYIEKNMLEEFNKINTEADLLSELRKRPHLNDIPILVKKHFHIE